MLMASTMTCASLRLRYGARLLASRTCAAKHHVSGRAPMACAKTARQGTFHLVTGLARQSSLALRVCLKPLREVRNHCINYVDP